MKGVIKLEPILHPRDSRYAVYKGNIYEIIGFDMSHALVALKGVVHVVNHRDISQVVVEYEALSPKTHSCEGVHKMAIPLRSEYWIQVVNRIGEEVEFKVNEIEHETNNGNYGRTYSTEKYAWLPWIDYSKLPQPDTEGKIKAYADQLQGRTPALSQCTCGQKMYTEEEAWNLVNDAFNKGRIGFPYHIFYNKWKETHKKE